jgi:hypothetical protein
MTDLMWATTKDSTSIHFGFCHKCHKHGRLFDLEHVRTCSELTGCPDITKYAQMLKGDTNIRLWNQEVLADAILQYTQLAVQLANLTARNLASLVHTPSKKKAPTGNRRGRPRATEVIAKTNHKVDDFFRKKTPQVNADRPMQQPEEKKQPEQPAEESKQHTGLLRVQIIEESKSEAFMTVKVDNPAQKREQMAVDLRKSKRQDLISKKRQDMARNQIPQENVVYSEQECYFANQEDEFGYEDFPLQPAQTVDQYLQNNQ